MQRTQSRKVVRLEVECLEDRCLPSTTFGPRAFCPSPSSPPAGRANTACTSPAHSGHPLDSGGHPAQGSPGQEPGSPGPGFGDRGASGPASPLPRGAGGIVPGPFLAAGPAPVRANNPPPVGGGDGSLSVAVAEAETPSSESVEAVAPVAPVHVWTTLLTPESSMPGPPTSVSLSVPASFPRAGGLYREAPPLEDPLFHLDPFLPLPMVVTPVPPEITSAAPDAKARVPATGFDLLAPLLPLGKQELEQAIQELMRRLDAALPNCRAPQSVADWMPWIIVLAGGAAAYEVGRRTLRRRSPEDDLSSGPIGGR